MWVREKGGAGIRGPVQMAGKAGGGAKQSVATRTDAYTWDVPFGHRKAGLCPSESVLQRVYDLLAKSLSLSCLDLRSLKFGAQDCLVAVKAPWVLARGQCLFCHAMVESCYCSAGASKTNERGWNTQVWHNSTRQRTAAALTCR